MNPSPLPSAEAFSLACQQARQGDLTAARKLLELPDSLPDAVVLGGIVDLAQTFEGFRGPEPLAALQPLLRALAVVRSSRSENLKIVLSTYANLLQGLSLLLSGDVHGANRLLTLNREELDRLCFLLPEFSSIAFSTNAAGHLALARIHLNAGNLPAAEKAFGQVRSVHERWIAGLPPEAAQTPDIKIETTGTRLEFSINFLREDLISFDVSALGARLALVRKDADELKPLLDGLKPGAIVHVLHLIVGFIPVFETVHRSLEIILVQRRPFQRAEAENLIRLEADLLHLRDLASKAGDRGVMFLYTIELLAKQRRNLLLFSRNAARDFGRYNGIVSLVSLVLLLTIFHLTFRPTGFEALLSLLAATVVALIAGFGYNALRFRPFVKLFSDALSKNGGHAKES